MIDQREQELQQALTEALVRYDAAKARARELGDHVLLERPVAVYGARTSLRERQQSPRAVAAREYFEADAALVAARGALNRHKRAMSVARATGSDPRPAA